MPSLLGRIGGALVGGVKGFVTGGPGGAARGAVTGFVGSRSRPPENRPSVVPLGRPMITPRMADIGGRPGTALALIGGGRQGPDVPATFPGAVPEPGFKGGLQRFLPGGQSGFTGAPPGYHINKAYMRHLVAASQGRATENPFNEPRAVNVVVKNRKMNPLNPRALMRANARQVAAVRLMRRTLRGSGYVIQRSGFGKKKTRRGR